ncbi:MAG: SulP family inorganic anion transporter [Bryobacteraceae bacterium]
MNRETFAKDFLASIVVFLVALPLCLGIAIASGVPPAAGLITGIVGGLVVGLFSGCPLQVSGPAAGLVVVVYQVVQEQGIEMLGPLVMMAGLIQLLAGMVKVGQLFRAISPSVIYGMLAGIGILIFASQFHVMVDDSSKGTGLENLLSIPAAVAKGVWPVEGDSHHLAAFVGVATLLVLLAWNQFAPKRLKLIPGALVAVIAATIIAAAASLPIRYVEIPTNLWASIQWTTLDTLAKLLTPRMILQAAAMAFVASAETLLCATAVDQMHDGPRTKYDRELSTQGVGNMLCGLLGAAPMTGVIVRSATNVNAGAKTRASAVMHGVWLLALVVALPGVLRMVPTASLAAILVYTGYKLVNPANVRRLLRYGGTPVVIYAATVSMIVATDLLTGILTGLALSFIKLIYVLTHMGVRVIKDPAGNRVDLHMSGAATFIRLPKLADALESIPRGMEAHVHFQKLDYIDHACLDALRSWEQQMTNRGSKVFVEWEELMGMYRESNSLAGSPRGRATETGEETTIHAGDR